MTLRSHTINFLLASILGATASGALECRDCETKESRCDAFLSVSPQSFVQSSERSPSSEFCESLGPDYQCPAALVFDGVSAGGVPTIEGSYQARQPNVRVTFVIQTMQNIVVSGGGVSDGDLDIIAWNTHSPAADVEEFVAGVIDLVPYSGDTWEGGWVAYDALVFDACENLSSYPVEFWSGVFDLGSWIDNQPPLGFFEGTDDTTINDTGYYNLNYGIQAQDEEGGVTLIEVTGKVTVLCTAAESL